MACATIKRSIDLCFHGDADTSSPSHKRTRCSSVAGLSHWRSSAEKRRRRILRLRQNDVDSCDSPRETPNYLQLFPVTDSQQTEGFIRSNLLDEVKRLKHRNQLSSEQPTHTSISTATPNPVSTTPTSSRDQPLFTLRQVETICNRLIQENEEKLREEYGHTLSEKLNEQYDAFLKFTHDHIQKQFSDTTCSYIM